MVNKNQNLVIGLPMPIELIERRIYVIRGLKVMLDQDLALLYQVETRVLNQAVSRNVSRFPIDFMFKLTPNETKSLRSQFVILEIGRGRHSKYSFYAFTEQGVAMLSSVLRSPRAIAVNIAIMRAFVKLREIMATHKDLARKIEQIQDKQAKQGFKINQFLESLIIFLSHPKNLKRKLVLGLDEL